MFVDELLPVYDVSDTVAVEVAADPTGTWRALMEADLIEVGRRRPLAGALGALRMLPEIVGHLLHGEAPPKGPQSLRLRDMTESPPDEGGWLLLGELPGEEIALGVVAKVWRPRIEYAALEAEEFGHFDRPGFAKIIYALRVQPLGDDRCLLSGTMRTATTDEHARRWFRRYWTFGVGPGAHVLVQGLLEMVREDAEGSG